MSLEAQPEVTVGYCRACGKPLDATTVRTAHGTLYCEAHVPLDTTGQPFGPSTPEGSSPYTAPPYPSAPYTNAPPPIPDPGVSPGVAFVLGLIPGVGAIYNGQYIKGLVHACILGILFYILNSDASNGLEPVFGLLIPVFWAYMAFEAYHTAKRRLRGDPVDEFSSLVASQGSPRFLAPAVLIVLGVILLLNNLGMLELRRMLRYWPVMMIGLGVYMLYLRLAGDAEAKRDR